MRVKDHRERAAGKKKWIGRTRTQKKKACHLLKEGVKKGGKKGARGEMICHSATTTEEEEMGREWAGNWERSGIPEKTGGVRRSLKSHRQRGKKTLDPSERANVSRGQSPYRC